MTSLDNNNNTSNGGVGLGGSKVSSKYIKYNISEELSRCLSSIIIITKTEKLILALCYKSPKQGYVIAKMLGKSYNTIKGYLSSLKRQELLKSQEDKHKYKHNKMYYSFNPSPEQLKSLPEDVKEYIQQWEANKK